MSFLTAFISPRHKSLAWSLITLGMVMLLGLLVWSLGKSFDDRLQQSRHQAERELLAIGHLQAAGIAGWREQRMADAWSLLDDSLFAGAVADWFNAASPEHAQRVQQRLRILQERSKYVAVYLVDRQGQVMLTAEGSIARNLPEPEQRALQKALSQAVAVAVEPRDDPAFAFPFFSVLTPLFEDERAIGAVWLVSDVHSTLYPLLNQWPTPSKTAE